MRLTKIVGLTEIVSRVATFLRSHLSSFAVVLLVTISANAQTPVLTRGPYLQSCNSNSIVVRWRTDLAVNSELRYGTNALALEHLLSVAGNRTEHLIKPVALLPGTKYFYSVGSSSQVIASGTNHFFVTAPVGASPLRIWVIGDSGRANQSAALVRDSYINFAQGGHTDLWLMLGDNAYVGYQPAVFDFYPQLLRNTCLWPAHGNHDSSSEHNDSFTLPSQGECGGVPSNSELYYSFNYGNIHFIVLDSNSDRSTNSPMVRWLRDDLAAAESDWLIAYWHHPPYTRGSHDSDTATESIEIRQGIVPILESHGVDLVLAGHSHVYERSFFLNGHYGASTTLTPSMKLNGGNGRTNGTGAYMKPLGRSGANKGTVYVVMGSSSFGDGSRGLRHPAMYFGIADIGSVILDVDENRLDARMLRGFEPNIITDYFTIIKTGPPRLEIANVTSGVQVSWSASAGAFQLQQTPRLASSNAWSIATNGVITSNNQNYMRIPMGASNQFFRLRSAP